MEEGRAAITVPLHKNNSQQFGKTTLANGLSTLNMGTDNSGRGPTLNEYPNEYPNERLPEAERNQALPLVRNNARSADVVRTQRIDVQLNSWQLHSVEFNTSRCTETTLNLEPFAPSTLKFGQLGPYAHRLVSVSKSACGPAHGVLSLAGQQADMAADFEAKNMHVIRSHEQRIPSFEAMLPLLQLPQDLTRRLLKKFHSVYSSLIVDNMGPLRRQCLTYNPRPWAMSQVRPAKFGSEVDDSRPFKTRRIEEAVLCEVIRQNVGRLEIRLGFVRALQNMKGMCCGTGHAEQRTGSGDPKGYFKISIRLKQTPDFYHGKLYTAKVPKRGLHLECKGVRIVQRTGWITAESSAGCHFRTGSSVDPFGLKLVASIDAGPS
ncbi:hypothetical protein C8R43DRAFT_1107506 [Mycena crocata]|nr:hypothetical protein C8R43DRAFT_1107506 [Mycena crocata]